MLLRRIRRIFLDPLDEALRWMERRAVPAQAVDWATLRRDARALAAATPTADGRCRAIRMTLAAIGDRHGQVVAPDQVARFRETTSRGAGRGFGLLALQPERVVALVFPDSPAARAGIQPGDVVEAVNGSAPTAFPNRSSLDLRQHEPAALTLSRGVQILIARLEPAGYQVAQAPSARRVSDFGYLTVPPSATSIAARYVEAAHDAVDAIDRDVRGWIVDLRGNLGGGVYLMLGAVGPILGEGDVGGLVDSRGRRHPWIYRRDGVFVGRKRRLSICTTRHARTSRNAAGAPVAILTSRLTASAGEAVAVAFSGRAGTRRFGEPTAGVATGLADKTLVDGTIVRCSTTVFADRTGRRYRGPIDPDEAVATDWACAGSEDDPVMRAAMEWLGRARP